MLNDQTLPVFDGHNDTLTKLVANCGVQVFLSGNREGHLDLPRAREAGLCGGIFAICVPAPATSPESNPMYGFTWTDRGYSSSPRGVLQHEYARRYTDSVFDLARQIEFESDGKVVIAKCPKDLERPALDIFTMVLGIEGAEAIADDISNLQNYYERGLRCLGVVWSRPNAFGEGVPYRFPHSPDTGPGLTRAGQILVKECNRMGVLLDLAHINEKGFWDVADLSQAPLVVSHTNVWELCHSTRNLTDEQLIAVARSSGVVGISFMPEGIDPTGRISRNIPITKIAEQFEYVADKIGVDHVAFGSDFDGTDLPYCLQDVTSLTAMIKTLRDRGFDRASLEKIANKNWLRVFKNTWKP